MKVTFLIFLPGFFLNSSIAQNCDIAQTGVAIVNAANTKPVASIATGQNANFKFSIANFGTEPDCSIPANSVTAIFDFPTLAGDIKPYKYDGPLSFVSGYFTWTYNGDDEVLKGTNTTAIPNGLGDLNILVKVKGYTDGVGSSNLKLIQGNGFPDHTGNNFIGAQLIIAKAAPLPTNLSAFTAVTENCDALLSWSTLSESDFSHFDIEYSPDGRTFITIGTVPGKNSATGADYHFTYTQLNGSGYYRLRQADIDGRVAYSTVIRATTNCNGKGKVLVYPNPLSYDQKLIVHISGYAGKIRGELFNAAGQRVSVHNLANKANSLSVFNLSSGVYTLYIKNNDKVDSFKVVIAR
jgi:hypothetical protein